MKKITILFSTFLLISACSNNQQNTAVVEVESKPLVEYVWHKAGPKFDGENLAMLINSWNNMIDNMECSGMSGANILVPEVKNEGYDFIWVMLWSSMDGRNKCWDDWTENKQSEWDVTINGIMEYDLNNVYLFETTVGQRPKIENNSGTFVNRFNFCNFNEGYSSESLIDFQNDIAATEWSDGYWYVLLNPTFEPNPKPDFVWLDLWADNADKEIAFGKYNESDLPGKYEGAFTCDNFDFSGTAIRR